MDQTRLNKPTTMPIGEIRFEDGTSILIPQPVKFQQMDPGIAWPHDAYIHTMPELPNHQAVLEWAANPPSVAVERQTEPLWAILSALSGGFLLLGVGLFFLILGLSW